MLLVVRWGRDRVSSCMYRIVMKASHMVDSGHDKKVKCREARGVYI